MLIGNSIVEFAHDAGSKRADGSRNPRASTRVRRTLLRPAECRHQLPAGGRNQVSVRICMLLALRRHFWLVLSSDSQVMRVTWISVSRVKAGWKTTGCKKIVCRVWRGTNSFLRRARAGVTVHGIA